MALKTKVKVGNITNLSDARYCAGMGVDWLGFRAGEIDLKTFEDITGWVAGPSFIIEAGLDTTLENLSKYPTDGIEIPLSRVSEVATTNQKTVFVSLPMSEWQTKKDDLIKLSDQISTIVFQSGIGEVSREDEVIREASSYFDVLIGYPFPSDRIPTDLLNRVGYNLQGSDEDRPGLKDYQYLADVLEKLEVE